MSLNKSQLAAVRLMRVRLDSKHAEFNPSREVAEALSGPARLYLETWVLPLLQFIETGEFCHGDREMIMRDAAAKNIR